MIYIYSGDNFLKLSFETLMIGIDHQRRRDKQLMAKVERRVTFLSHKTMIF